MRLIPTRIRFAAAPELTPKNIYSAIARHRRDVLRDERESVAEMARAWATAEIGIKKRLAAVTAQIALANRAGLPVSPSWLYQQERWQEFLRVANHNANRFAESALGIATKQQKSSVAAGLSDSTELAKLSGIGRSFKRIPAEQLSNLVGALADDSPLSDLFRTIAPGALQKAQDIMLDGLAAGENPRKIAARMSKSIRELTRDRAVTIARTESIRAYTEAQQQNYEANSDVVLGSRIVSARDSRTCPMCLGQDGKIIKHGEKFHRHPGCRCALAPVVEGLDIDRGTGEQWLRAQPKEVVLRKLGPARYKLWAEGKVSVEDLYLATNHPKWGPGLRLKNLRELDQDIRAGVVKGGDMEPQMRLPGMGKPGRRKLGHGKDGEPPQWESQFDFTEAKKYHVRAARRALSIIGDIHEFDHMDGSLITLKSSRARSLGAFGSDDVNGPFNYGELHLSTSEAMSPYVFAHEYGHAFDWWDPAEKVFNRPNRKLYKRERGQTITSEQAAALKEFDEATFASEELQRIRQALREGVFADGEDDYVVNYYLREHLSYLESRKEVWARAYAQYIAVKSQSPVMINEMKLLMETDDVFERITQWQDFDRIFAAVEAVLKAFGVKFKGK